MIKTPLRCSDQCFPWFSPDVRLISEGYPKMVTERLSNRTLAAQRCGREVKFCFCAPSRLGEQLSSFQQYISYAEMERAWRISRVLRPCDSASGSLLWSSSWLYRCIWFKICQQMELLSTTSILHRQDFFGIFSHFSEIFLSVEMKEIRQVQNRSHR